MDRRIQDATRRALLGDDHAALEALAARLRAGEISREVLELPAALGYEPALRLLLPEQLERVNALTRRSPAETKTGLKMVSKAGHFGYEAVLRGGIALTRATRERWGRERARHDLDLSAERLESCLLSVEDAVCHEAGSLRDHAMHLDTVARRLDPQQPCRALTRLLTDKECWTSLSLLALVGLAERAGFFQLGLEALAHDSVESFALQALKQERKLGKAKAEREVLAILRSELVPWALGLGDPLRRRRPDAPQPAAGGCAACGEAFEAEGWGGDRDRFCSTECYLEGGDALGGTEQQASHGQQDTALRAKRAAERKAHTRAYFRGEFD